jgi:hypothetical protein
MQRRANDLQKLVNQEARAVIDCYRTTNQGVLSMESGLRSAAAQLENRQRRFGLRLLSLPQGSQAGNLVGAASDIGKWLESVIGYSGRLAKTILLETSKALEADTVVEDDKDWAKKEAEKNRPGLPLSIDWSRLDCGATGYAVVWRRGAS